MTNFKEHDGLLFKMLEEHEIMPLKENDANVLVRFITHGVIGEYVMEHWLDCNQKNVPIYVEGVDSDGDVTVWIDEVHHCCPFPMFEIIGTLVKEGSAEWALYQMMQGKMVCHKTSRWEAWQQMLLGNKVWNPKLDSHKAKRTMSQVLSIYYIDGGNIMVRNLSGERSVLGVQKDSHWMVYAEPTGWQIYVEPEQPKPESENIIHGHIPPDMRLKYIDLGIYKVGDWVEHKESKEQATIRRIMSYGAIEIEFAYSTESDIYQANDFHNDFRKLSPSEVIVKIGCLSGTIGKSCESACFLMWHSNPKMDFDYSIIRFSALDTQTREIVESLLKAQEEEK